MGCNCLNRVDDRSEARGIVSPDSVSTERYDFDPLEGRVPWFIEKPRKHRSVACSFAEQNSVGKEGISRAPAELLERPTYFLRTLYSASCCNTAFT